VRLLLDEHLSHRIAGELRRAGYDVVAVAERTDLRGRMDRAIAATASQELRAIVTLDISDHLGVFRDALRLGRSHPGLVLLAPTVWAPSLEGIGPLVRALTELLRHAPGDAFENRVVWPKRLE
jgi:predicted nuclease of predicted toxin-antitoxin system